MGLGQFWFLTLQWANPNDSWLFRQRSSCNFMFLNVSSLWEYFDLEGPWQKVIKSPVTLYKQIPKNLISSFKKSQDFKRLGPGHQYNPVSILQFANIWFWYLGHHHAFILNWCCFVNYSSCAFGETKKIGPPALVKATAQGYRVQEY